MPTVHLICGATGAGKTTYATSLAVRVGGVRFSLDEWMAALFLPDRPAPATLAWAVERTARCESQIWSVGLETLARNVDIVLDCGFTTRAHRDDARTRALHNRAQVKLHFLDTEQETRRERIKQRNAQCTRAYELTDAMFDWMERAFEVPTDDELIDATVFGD